MTDKIFTVSEISSLLKKTLEASFSRVSLEGEVSNAKLHTSGHFYFSLKDEGAQIACVMYRSVVERIGKLPKEGDHVVIKGDVTVYPPSGRYQVTVTSLQPKGLGALLLKLEELKKKLQLKGYFDPAHKKPLPRFPKVIGVITSPTGAVIRDIVHVLEKRVVSFRLLLNPVKVQGEGAKEEIARAIEEMNHYHLCDVLIVGRGGGSIEDLWAFNEEIVAEAIFKSKIPIISAVGHETDVTLADFVADVRAPTPSSAAEMVCQERASLLTHLNQLEKRMGIVQEKIKKEKESLKRFLTHPFFSTADTFLGPKWQGLDEAKLKLDQRMEKKLFEKKIFLQKAKTFIHQFNPLAVLKQRKEILIRYSHLLDERVKNLLSLNIKKIEKSKAIVEYLNPKNILSKGYAILFSENKESVISSVASLQEGTRFEILLQDGSKKGRIEHENT